MQKCEESSCLYIGFHIFQAWSRRFEESARSVYEEAKAILT